MSLTIHGDAYRPPPPWFNETMNHLLEVGVYYLDLLEEAGEGGQRIFDRFVVFDNAVILATTQPQLNRRLVDFFDRLATVDLD